MVFTLNTREEAKVYHDYISDAKNYKGYLYPNLHKQMLQSGKKKLSWIFLENIFV